MIALKSRWKCKFLSENGPSDSPQPPNEFVVEELRNDRGLLMIGVVQETSSAPPTTWNEHDFRANFSEI